MRPSHRYFRHTWWSQPRHRHLKAWWPPRRQSGPDHYAGPNRCASSAPRCAHGQCFRQLIQTPRAETETAHQTEIPGYEMRRSEEHTSELQSRGHLVCRLLLEKKKTKKNKIQTTKKIDNN